MSITIRTFKIILLPLFVATYTYGQTRDTKNFTITPQTVVKTNLPKLDSCLFKLQGILRDRVGQSVIVGGMRASGNSVIELWVDFDLEGEEHYILDISAKKLSIRGATQKAIRCGLKALDNILQEETNNTAKKKIALAVLKMFPKAIVPDAYPIKVISFTLPSSMAACFVLHSCEL